MRNNACIDASRISKGNRSLYEAKGSAIYLLFILSTANMLSGVIRIRPISIPNSGCIEICKTLSLMIRIVAFDDKVPPGVAIAIFAFAEKEA